jgi:hypothetical protein
MTRKQAEKSPPPICPKKIQCCNAKSYLRSIRPPARLCTAATRSLTELSAFLDVSSLNLAVLRHRHFFSRIRRKAAANHRLLKRETSAARASISRLMSFWTSGKAAERSKRDSSI